MFIKPITTIAASLALVAPAIAQDAAAPAAPVEDAATMERAGLIFSLFASALQTEEIDAAEKDALIGCLYSNTLETVSKATGEAFAANPQIDGSDPANVYVIAATICGAIDPASLAADETPAPAE